jgi:septal ring-binding cell division protein DamX
MTDPHRPLLGAPGEVCRSCGAPLAEDQRYCVGCGARRGDTRLPFADVLAGTSSRAPRPSAGQAVPPSRWEHAISRLPVGATTLAGVACLILAMGVGVLIGSAGNGPDAAAVSPAPQVISVSAPAAVPSGTGSPTPTTAAGTATDARTGSTATKTTGSGATTPTTTKATNKALKALDSTSSGAAYQKKSDKLPKQLGTGGAAPPKDNKPAAGGSGFVDLG